VMKIVISLDYYPIVPGPNFWNTAFAGMKAA